MRRDGISDCDSSPGSERHTRGRGPEGTCVESLSFGCGARKGGPFLSLVLYTAASVLPPRSHPQAAIPPHQQTRGQGSLRAGGGEPVALLWEPSCPSRGSWCVLKSGPLVLFQMPVTFEDVALYLSREEWGRLDHAQQSFYRDVLQKRNGLSLGKGRGRARGGAHPPLPPPPLPGLTVFLAVPLDCELFSSTFLVKDVHSSCADGAVTAPRLMWLLSTRNVAGATDFLFIY